MGCCRLIRRNAVWLLKVEEALKLTFSLKRSLNTAKIGQKWLLIGDLVQALQRLGLEYRHETSREMPQKDSFLGLRRERRGSELVGEFHGSL